MRLIIVFPRQRVTESVSAYYDPCGRYGSADGAPKWMLTQMAPRDKARRGSHGLLLRLLPSEGECIFQQHVLLRAVSKCNIIGCGYQWLDKIWCKKSKLSAVFVDPVSYNQVLVTNNIVTRTCEKENVKVTENLPSIKSMISSSGSL